MDFLQDPATLVVVILLILPIARIAYVLYAKKDEGALGGSSQSAVRKHKTRLK